MGNLALTRRKNEEVIISVRPEEKRCFTDIVQHADREDIVPMINSLIKIKVVDIIGNQVRLSFNAPRHFTILRSEIYIPVKEISRPAPSHKRNLFQKLLDKMKKCA